MKYDFYCEEALSGKTPVNKVYESEHVVAFHHTRPSYALHIVVVPKKHIPDLLSLEKEDLSLFAEVQTVAKLVAARLDLEQDGLRLITNMGEFQDTPHLHFHLVSGTKEDHA